MFDSTKKTIKKFLKRLKSAINEQSKTGYYCPVCKKENVSFRPLPFYYFRELDKYQHAYSIFQSETLNMEFYSCSHCKANDRNRLYALYFDKYLLSHPNKKLKILDIAPDAPLTSFLRSIPDLSVRTADLFMEGVDDKVDITNMEVYEKESFDVFICSHVLEHIENDIGAMKELYRILNKGGWGIAMVPINLGLEAIHEDPSITDEASRWKYFGQNDHIRMYSKKGFVERLGSVGFHIEQLDISYFGADLFKRCGIHPRSVLYVVHK